MRFMDIEEQVDADFTRARRRAFVRRMGAGLRGVQPGPACDRSRKSGRRRAPTMGCVLGRGRCRWRR